MAATSDVRRGDAEGWSGTLGWALLLCLPVWAGFVASSPRFQHWFVIPVLACGLLVALDAIPWLRRRIDLFDPVGVIGLYGWYFFFLTPLLHVQFDQWLPYIVPPDDWRPWLGRMAVLNAAGLLAYRIARWYAEQGRVPRGKWEISPRFLLWILLAATVAAIVQALVYSRFGGIGGYIEAESDAFTGYGIIFLISDKFAIFLVLGWTGWLVLNGRRPSLLTICLVLVAVLVASIFFGGLRGSRSHSVYNLFWVVGIIHLILRPIPRTTVVFGLLGIVLFMYLYGFYKEARLQGAREAVTRVEAWSELEALTGRSKEGMLLGDFGRVDVQAYVLYSSVAGDYRPAYGRTYVGTLALLIPSSLWPTRPPIKIKEGTEALYGEGAYEQGLWSSSAVFGLAGETLLNFGPAAVALAFLVFGVFVGKLRRWIAGLLPGDGRRMIAPFFVNLALIVLIGDSDNILVFLLGGVFPMAIVLLGCRRHNPSAQH